MGNQGSPQKSPALIVSGLNFTYRRQLNPLFKDLDLTIESGEIGCLIGHSGCGKTTLLRAIVGIIPITSGTIKLGGKVVSSVKEHVPIEKRNIGMFFQDYALFPHLTVAENISFGLFRWKKSLRQARVKFLTKLLAIDNICSQFPHEISGGQKQRVALARGLAPEPQLLLLDEPFSNLDSELREFLVFEIREVLKKTRTTALVVTHDQQEAFSLGDKMGVFLNGSIAQWGGLQDLYHRPVNRFVANFVGDGAILPGRLILDKLVKTELGKIYLKEKLESCPSSLVEVLVRPEDLCYDEKSPLMALLVFKSFRGSYYIYHLKLASGYRVYMFISSRHKHQIGQSVRIRLKSQFLTAFPLKELE
ncbi:MAG: ABC transporter ATP-binding protein [SAR324 cluster bacterium]|nr:ABC transporter ATP-binding protein [SAR324 cluster bacterium]